MAELRSYEDYMEESARIREREKTACMTRPNAALTPDPREWAEVDDAEASMFWENLKCHTI
jgi:hypothetical protein